MKKQLYRFLKAFVKAAMFFALELLYSLSVTYFFGKWAVAYAYAERGYEAFGGEYLLILLCFITSFYAIRKLFEYVGGKHGRSNETGSRGADGGENLG